MATKTIKTPKFVNGKPTADIEEIQIDDLGTSSWGPKDKHTLINTKIPRVDAPLKTTGAAKYTHDIRAKGMLHGRFVSSTRAHARVTTVDLSAAQKIEGVKAVLPVVPEGGEVRYEG